MANNTVRMTAEDKKWRGRDAARTLMEAEKIKNDPTLSKLAAAEAKNMMNERKQELEAMSKVANKLGATTKPATKTPKPKTTSSTAKTKSKKGK